MMTRGLPKTVSVALTYLGALPFFLALIPALPVLDLLLPAHGIAFRAYGATIAAFMAGSLWGLCQREDSPPTGAIVLSNVLALAACASLLMPESYSRLSLIIQLVAFWALFATDYRLRRMELEAAWYLRLRAGITLLVTLAYSAALVVF